MPKLKSNRGASKRFRATKNGFKCRKTKRNHMMSNKPTKMKRKARASLIVRKEDLDRIKQMLPHH